MFYVLSSCKSCPLLFTVHEITLIPTLLFSYFKTASAGYAGPWDCPVVVTSWAICIACDIRVLYLLQPVRQESDFSASFVCHSADLGHI